MRSPFPSPRDPVPTGFAVVISALASREEGGAASSLGLLPAQGAVTLAQIGKTQGIDGDAEAGRSIAHVDLDIGFAAALLDALARDPVAARALPVATSSALCRSAGAWRVFQRVKGPSGRVANVLARFDDDEVLTMVLARAADAHPTTMGELIDSLVGTGFDREEADGYVRSLLAEQLIVPALAPAPTAEDPWSDILALLARAPATRPLADSLAATRARLRALREVDTDAARDAIARASESLVLLACDRGASEEVPPLSTTWSGCSEEALDADTVARIGRTCGLLFEIGRPYDLLAPFRAAFVARYGDRFVPLTEALDPELGVGFPASSRTMTELDTISSASFDPAALFREREDRDVTWGWKETALLRTLAVAVSRGDAELRLTEDEARALAPRRGGETPFASFTAIVSFASDGTPHVAAAVGCGGLVAASTLGHHDAELVTALRAHARVDEALAGGALLAEVVYVRDAASAAQARRARIFDHEIPYQARASVAPSHRIDASDLRVGVRGGRVVLRSDRLARDVAPRLTCAQGVDASDPPIVRFLSAMQTEAATWQWGPLVNAPFLPRVLVDGVVVSLARVRLLAAEVVPVLDAPIASRPAALEEWRAKHRVPRHVVLRTDVLSLPIDFEDASSVARFVAAARGVPSVTLYEDFAQPRPGRRELQWLVPFHRPVSDRTRTDLRLAWASRELARAGIRRRVVRIELHGGPTSARCVLAGPCGEWLLTTGTADLAAWRFDRALAPGRGMVITLAPSEARDVFALAAQTAALVAPALATIVVTEEERSDVEDALDVVDCTECLALLRGSVDSPLDSSIAGASKWIAGFGLSAALRGAALDVARRDVHATLEVDPVDGEARAHAYRALHNPRVGVAKGDASPAVARALAAIEGEHAELLRAELLRRTLPSHLARRAHAAPGALVFLVLDILAQANDDA